MTKEQLEITSNGFPQVMASLVIGNPAMKESVEKLCDGLAPVFQDAARYGYLRNTPPWQCAVNVVMAREAGDDIALLAQDGLDAVIDAALIDQAKP